MLKFNKDLAAVHAYLCADGYVIRNPKGKSKYYYIGFRNMNTFLLDDFERRFFNYFKIKPRRMKDGRSIVQNKNVYMQLTEKHNYYSKDWNFPNLSRENLKVWLRAYFDCDGWVANRKAVDRHIGLDSINYKGLMNIKWSLIKWGIKSRFKDRTQRNIYRLLIYGKDNLIRFRNNINFNHPTKKDTLKKAIESYVEYKWQFNNKPDIIPFLRNRVKESKKKRIRICSKYAENLEFMSRFLDEEYMIESKIYGPLRNGINTKFYELCIQKKESVERLREAIKS